MICEKCGHQLNDTDASCPICNNTTETQSDYNVENTNSKNKKLGEKISEFFSGIAKKLGIKSIFDDTVARTTSEKKTASRYMILLFCSITLIFLWFSFNTSFSLSLISLNEELELVDQATLYEFGIQDVEFSTSMGKVLSALSSLEQFIGDPSSNPEAVEGTKTFITIINIVSIIYTIVSIALIISPFITLLALLKRKTNAKVYIKIESWCFALSFTIHTLLFLIFKLFFMILNQGYKDSTASTTNPFNISYSFIFLVLFIVSFVLIHSIKKTIKNASASSVSVKEKEALQ